MLMAVGGRFGGLASGRLMSSVVVRSPTVDRRHWLMLGMEIPNRFSRKSSMDVWSKTSGFTEPPRENGERTRAGTRNPSPMGPRIPPVSTGRVAAVRNSPGVPTGATGGGT